MKKLYFVLTLAALALPQAGQAGWYRIYGSDKTDGGHCVQQTDDGGYIVAGTRGAEFWLIKTDTSGYIAWQTIYEEGGVRGKHWLEETSDGGYIVSWSPGLLKADSNGKVLWTRDYGINSYCVDKTSDGGYIVTGDRGYFYPRLVFVKTDSQGDTLWTRDYLNKDWVSSGGDFVQETEDNGYIVVGAIEDTGIVSLSIKPQHMYIYLVKTDKEGEVQWERIFSSLQGDRGTCVRQTGDSGYVITSSGYFIKTNEFGDTSWVHLANGGATVQQTSDGGYILVNGNSLKKTNETGDTVWSREYDGSFSCAHQTSDDGYIVTGYIETGGASREDLYLVRTDSLGLLAVTENPRQESESDWEVVSQFGNEVVIKYSDWLQGFEASVFDVSGRKIDRISNPGQSGFLTWGKGYTSGVYFIQALKGKNSIESKRIVVIR